MSSLIEQAAQRLAQLREAGIVVPEIAADHPVAAPAPAAPAAAAGSAAVRQPPVVAPVEAPSPSQSRHALSRRVDLDLDVIAAMGIVTPNAPRSQLADQYRVIKRPLIANATGRGATTVDARQPDHGDQRGGRRGQELHVDQPGDEHRGRARPHGDAGRRRRGAPLGAARAGPAARPRPARRAGRQGRHGQRAAAHQRRQADHPAQRLAAPAGHRAAGQRGHDGAAGRHGHALPRPHHHLRLAAAAADDRVARAGHAHGADRRRRACRQHAAVDGAAARWPPSRPARSR